MIVNNGLGDDSSSDSSFDSFDWTPYLAIGLGAFLIMKLWNSGKQETTFSRKKLTKKRIMAGLEKKVPKSKILSEKETQGLFGDLF